MRDEVRLIFDRLKKVVAYCFNVDEDKIEFKIFI